MSTASLTTKSRTRKGENPEQPATSTSGPTFGRNDNESGDGDGTTQNPPEVVSQLNKAAVQKNSEGNPLEDLRCSICMDFFIEPTLTDCAHVFCNFCIHHWFENRGSSICPQCRNIVQQVFPSPDLNEKVEKYVTANLNQELLEERERTKQTRRQEMNFIAHDLPMPTNADSAFTNAASDFDELFWTVTMQQEELPDFSLPSMEGYTLFSDSLADQPLSSPSQPLDETPSDLVDDALQQFEYRLDRAQRAYGVLVSAQREMSHQLEHLQSISHRLERYDRLGNRSTGSNPTMSEPDPLENIEPRSTSNEYRFGQLGDVPLPTSSATTHDYSSLDPSDMWQWLPCHSMTTTPCSHSHWHLSGNNARHHSAHCCENYRYSNAGCMYEHRGCGLGRSPIHITPTYSSGYHHEQYPSNSTCQHPPATTGTSERRRPPRRQRYAESSVQNYGQSSCNAPSLVVTPTLEDEYMDAIRNRIAEDEFAEAIERSLAMDMFEPHYDGHQQISVRSSQVVGPSSQNITSISIETDFLPDISSQNYQLFPPREIPATRRRQQPNNGSRRRHLR